jgi:hypothetical protein
METKTHDVGVLSPLQKQRYAVLLELLPRMVQSVEEQSGIYIFWFAPGRSTLKIVMEWMDLEQRHHPNVTITLGRNEDGKVWLKTDREFLHESLA